jgi:hypothetical protein
MKIDPVMRDIMNLQEYQVQVTVPEGFRFYGLVPFDMNIVSNQAFVTVVAPSLTEAVRRVQDFFNRT